MKKTCYIFASLLFLLIVGCTGSRKYFKAAAKLEKQGLVNEAAEYYFESLQRSPSNVDARIKLKEVGQKYVSNLSSEFFRNYNTQQTEASLETFERLKNFHARAAALNVQLDYPRSYEEDYQKAVETYCSANYNKAFALVNQKKYYEALPYIKKVEKYNGDYRNLKQLDIIATCEPLYQSAITNLENKNYAGALNLLANIRAKSENYKDSRDLLELATANENKSLLLFPPKPSRDPSMTAMEDFLFNNFNQMATQKLKNVSVINNSPFHNGRVVAELSSGNDVDLIQAIRKATGADYFYIFEISNKREQSPGLQKTLFTGYHEVRTKSNDVVTTEYKKFEYNQVKTNRTFSYDFKYQLMNAYNNQIIGSQVQSMRGQDAIEYNEFVTPGFVQKYLMGKSDPGAGDINSLYPYNPQQTPVLSQYNPRNWRGLFSARSNLKTFEELKNEALNANLNQFVTSLDRLK